jgi:methylisocitrate lyase
MTSFRLAMKAIETGLLELKTTGTQEGVLDAMQTRQELYRLLDYTPSGMTSPLTPVTC